MTTAKDRQNGFYAEPIVLFTGALRMSNNHQVLKVVKAVTETQCGSGLACDCGLSDD